jgi:NADH-quinone oxidoreductase subunit K
LLLVLCFFNSAVIWILLEAEFLGIVLVLVYVGAVMVLFLFVVMMLDVNLEELRKGLANYWPLAVAVAGFVVFAMINVIVVRHLGGMSMRTAPALAAGYSNTRDLGRRDRADAAPAHGRQAAEHRAAGCRARERPRSNRQNGLREKTVITLTYVLTLSGILFAIAVAGVFLNRKNVIVLLMCIELMLLAVNFNFVAFSRYLGDIGGQIFVFFILTVAAAESAIGLAILVVVFRERRSIEVEDLDTLQG